MNSLIGYSIQSGQPRNQIHTNNRNILNRLYLYTFVHTHTYGTLIIKAKEVYKFGGGMGVVGERKVGEKEI